MDDETIIIFSIGKHFTRIYKDGKVYGKDIRGIGFYKDAGEFPMLDVRAADLPVFGNGDSESLKCFLNNISNEIQKYISKNQDSTVAVSVKTDAVPSETH